MNYKIVDMQFFYIIYTELSENMRLTKNGFVERQPQKNY